MPDLIVDGPLLDGMRSDVQRIRTEFEHANRNSDRAAEDCGHRRLGDRVRDFAHNWDSRRKELVEQLETLDGQLENIREGFVGTDADLATSLSSPPPARTAPGVPTAV